MELGGGDDFCQLLHVGGLDVDDVEALILDVEVPQVDSQIVAADVRLPIAVDGYAVDMVGVRIGIGPLWNGGDNGIVVRQARELQVGSVLEVGWWRGAGSTSSAGDVGRCDIVGEVVFSNNLERLFRDLPELDCLVIC